MIEQVTQASSNDHFQTLLVTNLGSVFAALFALWRWLLKLGNRFEKVEAGLKAVTKDNSRMKRKLKRVQRDAAYEVLKQIDERARVQNRDYIIDKRKAKK